MGKPNKKNNKNYVNRDNDFHNKSQIEEKDNTIQLNKDYTLNFDNQMDFEKYKSLHINDILVETNASFIGLKPNVNSKFILNNTTKEICFNIDNTKFVIMKFLPEFIKNYQIDKVTICPVNGNIYIYTCGLQVSLDTNQQFKIIKCISLKNIFKYVNDSNTIVYCN